MCVKFCIGGRKKQRYLQWKVYETSSSSNSNIFVQEMKFNSDFLSSHVVHDINKWLLKKQTNKEHSNACVTSRSELFLFPLDGGGEEDCVNRINNMEALRIVVQDHSTWKIRGQKETRN